LGALVTNSLARVWAAVTSIAEKTSGKASVLSKVPKCAEFHAKFKVIDERIMSICYLHATR
jgi:hypothetical protein